MKTSFFFACEASKLKRNPKVAEELAFGEIPMRFFQKRARNNLDSRILP